MDSISKGFALILIGIMAISCMSILTVESVSAQTIPRPSVPEFTSRLTASSLEVTIKNQPLTGIDDINVSNPDLYYGFRFKDPNNVNIGDWYYAPIYFVGLSSYGTYYESSPSDNTIISFPLDDYPFEGDTEAVQIFKNPQRYKLKDECDAIEALNETGRKIGFSIIVRFNSKKNSTDQIKTALKELSSSPKD